MIEFSTMRQVDVPYFPVHPKCGKRQPSLTESERQELLRAGRIPRHCEECGEPWIFQPSQEQLGRLRILSGER
jgi:hypothetical protein